MTPPAGTIHLFFLLTAVAQAQEPVLTGDEILARVAASQANQAQRLPGWTGHRAYLLDNQRFNVKASMTVEVEFSAGTGKTFKILQVTGPQRVRERVLEPLLKTESEESQPGHRNEYALTPANYKAQLERTEQLNGTLCYVLRIEPLRHSRYLLRGTLWVDRDAFQPVKLEGKPAGSISFWVAEPTITETMRQWDGFWFPEKNVSVSSGFLLGTSRLEIDYTDYRITSGPRLEPAQVREPRPLRPILPSSRPIPVARH